MPEATRPREARCHCGMVRFTVALPEEPRGARCNCSICAMKGAVTVYAPLDALEVTQGEDALGCYRFNTGTAKHYFCSNCGIHCFHRTRSNPDTYGINAACLEGVSPFDFAEIGVSDGIHHPSDHGGARQQFGRLRFGPFEDD